MSKENPVKNPSTQMSLLDYIEQAAELARQGTGKPAGSLNIDAEFVAAVKEDLRHAKDDKGCYLSVAQVAARMSDLTGFEITESKFRNWTAPSHPHDFPCLYLPAFVVSTGGQRRAFEVLSRHAGLFALPGPEALRAEIERRREEEKKTRDERHRLETILKEIDTDGR